MLKNVKTGQPVSAKRMSEVFDLANRAEIKNSGVSVKGGAGLVASGQAILAPLHNSGTTDIPPFSAVIIAGQAKDQTGRGVLLLGSLATESNPAMVAVSVDPIPADRIGRVALAGVAWAKRDGTDGEFATPNSSGSFSLLEAGDYPVIGVAGEYALIRIGGTGGGSASGDLVPHSHGGRYDGGWAGFLSGGL